MRVDGLIEDFAAHLSDDPNTSPRTAEFNAAHDAIERHLLRK